MFKLLWLTQRGERHQQSALAAAPPSIEVTVRRDPNPQELAALLADADFLISERSGVISAEILAAAPRLKSIVRLGSLDFDIDLEACRARGIMVSRQPVIGSMMVAEHVMMVTLALLKRFNETQAATLRAEHGQPPARSDENTFRYNWNQFSGIGGLVGKQVGIVGMGEIGVELVRRLQAFLPAAILYHKRTPYPATVEQSFGIRHISFEECCQTADILVGLLPYSPLSDLILNRQVFEGMKMGSLLVHAGSGGTVHEGDLIAALQSGRLGGAALDTYEYEPLPTEHPLIQYARDPAHNLILTPHVAAGTLVADFRKGDYAEIQRYLAGESLRYRVV